MRADLERAKLEQILVERQTRIHQRVNSKNEIDSSKVLNPDSSDLAQDYYLQERNTALIERLEGTLEQVETALQRINDGNYGKCTLCGKDISTARLKALPHAELCINCQKLEEKVR